jgi:hypothetical protein
MIRKALVTLTGTLEVEIDDEEDDLAPEEMARAEASWDCHCDVVEFHDVEWQA